MIVEVDGVLVSTDILTEPFCCDLSQCGGQCCVEGDAGAPLKMDEVMAIENSLDAVWPRLTAGAQSVIDRQGVAYSDPEGDLVTSIVNGRDCAFAFTGADGCCLCALEQAYIEGLIGFRKPISCALYPIREVSLFDGMVGLNYNRWAVCKGAIENGRRLGLTVYRFLEAPLKRRFGSEWYEQLKLTADEMKRHGIIP